MMAPAGRSVQMGRRTYALRPQFPSPARLWRAPWGDRLCPVDGILLQTTRSIRELIALATEGAPPEQIELSFAALEDQWTAAEREALTTPAGSIDRFDARAAAVLGSAYRPVLKALGSGRVLASDDVDLAHRSAGWLNLAYESLLAGDHGNVERCLGIASTFVGIQSQPDPDASS